MNAERVAERIEYEQAVNERVNAITSNDIYEEVERIRRREGVSSNRKVSQIDKAKAKNSIIKRIREEEYNNMNLRYFERQLVDQLLF